MLPVGGGSSDVVFGPQVLGVVGEGLVQSQLTPFLTRHQITEPVVGQFMGDYVVGIAVHQGAGVGLNALLVDGSRRVFHRPGHEIAHGDLGVFFPGKLHSENIGEKSDHFGRPAKNSFGIVGVFGFYVVAYFQAIGHHFFGNSVFPHRNHGQIGRVG